MLDEQFPPLLRITSPSLSMANSPISLALLDLEDEVAMVL
jgi:hypothetical protein